MWHVKSCAEFLPAGGGGTSSSRQLACENDRDPPRASCAAALLGTQEGLGLKVMRVSCAADRRLLT